MSEIIHWILEVDIVPGQLENFRGVAKELIASTQKEPGTLCYDWSLSDDGTACHIYERYANSAAVVTHVQSFAKVAERFLQAARPTRFHVYGKPSDEVKTVLADFHPVYFAPLGGISR